MSGGTLLLVGAAAAGLYVLSKRQPAARGDMAGSTVGSGKAGSFPGASFNTSGRATTGVMGGRFLLRPGQPRGDGFGSVGGSF